MSDDFNRGTRNFDGVSFEDATLPSGYKITENGSGDLVIKDTNGNTVFRWDASAGEWDLESNGLTNISSVSTDNVNRIRYVTADGGFKTIQAAHDDLGASGGRIHVTGGYQNGDDFPVDITKPVILTGDGPGETVIDPGSTTPNVIQIDLGGSVTDGFLIRDLKISQGQDGISVLNTAYGKFENVQCFDQGRSGIALENATSSLQLTMLDNVDVRSAGDVGIKADSDAIAALFLRCTAIDCSGDGLNFSGVMTKVIGGAYEQNGGIGIDVRANEQAVIRDAYFENNSQIEVNHTADGGLVAGCRFNGLGSTDRAINLNGATDVHIRNNFVKDYNEAINITSTATDCDIHQSENHVENATYVTDSGTRTRSDGIIGGGSLGGVDVSTVSGQFEGDRAQSSGATANTGDTAYSFWTWDATNAVWTDQDGNTV